MRLKLNIIYDKLKDFNENLIKWRKPVPPDYCKMVGIIHKDYANIVLDNCFKIDTYISKFMGEYECTEYNKHDSVEFVWLVPLDAVEKLREKASRLKAVFKKVSVISFEIHEVTVYDQRIPIIEVCVIIILHTVCCWI